MSRAQFAETATKASANHLNRQLGAYSLAAAAAGVTALALTPPAAGEVVVTKKTIPIPLVFIGSKENVEISMANNGIANVYFQLYSEGTGEGGERALVGWGPSYPDGIACGGNFYAKALALPRGAKIGPTDQCFSGYLQLIEATDTASFGRYSRGYWGGNPKNRYLGVRFTIDGQLHYGWVRLTVTTDIKKQGSFMSAEITAYAYETVANKPILAGTAESSTTDLLVPQSVQNSIGPSLGMLAKGADALPMWRHEEALPSQ